MKINFVVYTENGGDGSAYPIFLQNKEQAEAIAGTDSERFCEDIQEESLEIDTRTMGIKLSTEAIYRLLHTSYRDKLIEDEFDCPRCGRHLAYIRWFRDIVDADWGSSHDEKTCIRFKNGDWKKPASEWKEESR